ncbi:MAG: DUF5666 domain-containing protein [Phycisphaerae bacterium]|nr:DUF5666 domain-containing protein [Phycisphaerae bacterium]
MSRALLVVAGLVFVLGVTNATRAADTALKGKVVSVNVDKGEVVVKPKEGADVTVTTNADTKVKVDGKDAKLADVKAGMGIEVKPATGVAASINAHTPKPATGDVLKGTVVSVDAAAKTLVVKPTTGDNVTVTTDADTKVKVDRKAATLAEVKAGMIVEVKPATGVAKTINAHTPKPTS